MAQDLQNRSVVRVSLDVSEHVYLPIWSITNLKSQSPDNSNIFAGIGYRDKSWWTEGMVQKQWSASGGLWSVDGRFKKQKGRFSIYAEPSVLLMPRRAFFEFVIVEERVWRGLALRQETENTHTLSKQKIAVGAGGSWSFAQHWGWDFSLAAVYRFSPTGPNESRVSASASKRLDFRKLWKGHN